MGTIHWYEDEAGFREKLERGRRFEDHVVKFFENYWFHKVEVGPREFRKDIRDARNFILELDLRIDGWPVEVKGRPELNFSWSPSSFPYPSAIVDTVNKYDVKDAKIGPPVAYVFVSGVTWSMLCCNGRKTDRWFVQNLRDRDRGYYDDFYLIPKEDLRRIERLHKHICDLNEGLSLADTSERPFI